MPIELIPKPKYKDYTVKLSEEAQALVNSNKPSDVKLILIKKEGKDYYLMFRKMKGSYSYTHEKSLAKKKEVKDRTKVKVKAKTKKEKVTLNILLKNKIKEVYLYN